MREDDERYFERLESRLDEAFDVAERAKAVGDDPKPEVEIPTARDMADRVENILGIDGVAERVRELEGEMSREEAALALVEDFVEGSVGDYESREGKVEGAVRTAVALLTEGVVAAPIEGIDRVELLANDDGTEFVNVYYAGPIRSAGGTAQALSVLVADYARSLLDIEEFNARNDEVERYAEEVALYDKETGLQYSPKDKETKFIAEHMPIMLDGEATGDEEVSGFRDLERVDTNSARGGMCLVLAEGIALKAPKIQRYTRQLDEVDWPWLQDLIDGTIGDGDDADDEAAEEDDADESVEADADAGGADEGEERAGPPRPEKSKKYLRDLIAGRPVFGHPSESGGFRLRYGRARNHGFATAGVHPATMHLVDDFLATGTQIKTERPGKAAGVVPVDSIDGPTVRLANGDVRRIDDPAEAKEVRNGVESILDLGEYLVNYGEFVENNHPLAPASYTVEWWRQDLEAAGCDVQALSDSPRVDLADPDASAALDWAREYDAPLHPQYTYMFHDVSVDDFETLADAVAGASVEPAVADGGALAHDGDDDGDGNDETRVPVDPDNPGVLVLERTETTRRVLERLLVTHRQTDDELRVDDWVPLAASLGVEATRDPSADGPTVTLEKTWDATDLSERAREYADGENAIEAANEVAPFELRERAPTRIGNRMGRPEKSESRDLSPAVHTLFPIGEAGGSQRSVSDAAKHAPDMRSTPGIVEVDVGRRRCESCGTETWRARCPECTTRTEPEYWCPFCEQDLEPDEAGRVYCDRCDADGTSVEPTDVDVNQVYQDAMRAVGERENAFDILKGVQGLLSANKTPEPMEKGVLRAKHGVTSFKDGTVRYDMTDLPVTAVRPSELDATADQFKGLGYETDVHGDPLKHDDQLVELKVQDIVLSDGAAEHMLKTADFVDDLLAQYYDLERFYEFDDRDDLIGELVFGMAPHTSAATVGRVVGFTSAAVGYAHPYFHAAKRRNCFHPETKVWYRDEHDEWHHNHIETLVKERLDPETADEDDFGALVQELDGEVHVPSVTPDGEEIIRPVDAVSKHPAPEHLVDVKTRSGRELTVTADHSMRLWEGGVERVKAGELEVGDSIPMPKELDFDGQETALDLLAEFIDSSEIPNEDLTIVGAGSERLKQLLDDATDSDQYLNPVADALDVSNSTVYNWVSRDSIPVAPLLELFDAHELVERVPTNTKLSVRRDTATINRMFTIDERVSRLLGYFAAEGFSRQENGSFYQTTICIPDAAPRAKIKDTFQDVLGVEAYEENEWKVTVSSRLVAVLFSKILNCGSRAETKRIPDAVFGSPKSHLQSFLAAYFAGDGSASSDRIEVRATTVSDDLKTDLVAALKRFGIVPKTYKETRTPQTGAVAEFYDEPREFSSWTLKITSSNAARFAERVGFTLDRKQQSIEQVLEETELRTQRLVNDGGELWLDEVVSVDYVESEVESTYSLTVAETNTLVAEDCYVGQCDGDEDCVMLLLDGLLNFSKTYLPDKRGGRMDAPLVMSSRIDPSEIDDEAHNMDVMWEYPREFYEATREMADPEDVEDVMTIAEENLGTEREYTDFFHTHDTSDLALGPDLSAYKTLGSMEEKMDAQLHLSRNLRAVDETDVAERIIEGHFLPDLIGNLRAFARQETRCLDCGEKYRRMPLTGDCRECGGRVNLTVHEGSVNKYMQTAIDVADDFGCRPYTKQRLEKLERALESIFENDHNKQSGIADFM
ncbi:LAGLIDADG family homing endonuclease [Halorubellus litoreus]|uniref:DNA polymerase II large subunit n=1 Tax=Halorubellus litoreus TaxID=755308 RepID=A0ABD5V9S2_9EURY